MLNSNMLKLAKELGFDQINEELEADITSRLDKVEKLEQIDTVTFGLETDDGKIVKVFVNEKDVAKFEKLMGDALGSTDSIEDAINKAAAEVDIVDVEWPEVDDEEDVLDGSEALDPKVYNKANLAKEVQAGLQPKHGGEPSVRTNVAESAGHLGDRLVTANQQLVYQAIIDLGIPEDALSRSSYRASILLGIKETAKLLMRSPALKIAIKQLIKNRISVDNKDTPHKKDEDVSEGVLVESATTELYWSTFNALLKRLDDSQDQHIANAFLNLPKIVMLSTRSVTPLTRKISAQVKIRLQALSTALEEAAAKGKAATQPAVAESLSSVEVAQGISKMLNFAEPENLKAVEPALTSAQGRQMLAMVQRKASMLPSVIKQRFELLLTALDAVPVTEAQDGYQLGAFTFTEEQAEIAMKALANRVTTKLTTVDGKTVILSPRPGLSFIKQVGSNEKTDITAEQLETMKAALT